MNAPTNFVNTLSKRSDLILAAMLISIIFMMVIPIPTILIDMMIAVNIAIAIVLLMVAIYIPSPLAFAAFPSVLLITTLFRLALSISTTRLILLEADAGQIIYAFGDFVVGGNMIVGLVIFLIITIVSFVVVTKGSERVAEVSARFSLDGMPGKQMSIDSDMRSGVITMAQARQRRQDLESENHLYGAMDGAMKFVKGDAIAGIIIIFVNLIGGLSVGVLQQGMSAGEALQIYSILTIGDGLVAQIPALFVAVTAGIIVTRVTSTESVNLGADISKQVMAQPRAIIVGSALMFGFAWMPGFPTVIFLCLSALIGMTGLILMKVQKQTAGVLLDDDLSMQAENNAAESAATNEFSPNAPVVLEVAHTLREAISPVLLNNELAKVRRALYQSVGVPFPGVHLRFNPEEEEGRYAIFLYDLPVAQGQIRLDSIFPIADMHMLNALNIPFETDNNFLPGLPTHWVKEEHSPLLQLNQVEVLSIPQILSHHLAHVLRHHAYQFTGIQETHFLLAQAEAQYSELIKEVYRNMPISKIADVLRRLVKEGVSITNLRAILEGLVEGGPQFEDVEKLTEYVRSHLKNQISYKYSDNNILPVYLIDPDTEETLRDSIRQTPQGTSLVLEPGDSRSFIDSINSLFSNQDNSPGKIVLLTSYDLRRHIRKLIEMDFHDLPVLSFQELAPEITVQPLGRINLIGHENS